MKKYVLFSAVGILTASAIIASTTAAFAQSSDTQNQTLAQRIAARFKLNENEVQTVIDEEHAARHAKMQELINQRLTQAVADGRLTEEQKQLIIAKQAELQKKMAEKRASLQTLTSEERKSALESARAELEAWAKEHDIDMTYVAGGKRGMMGMGKGWGGNMGEDRLSN